jgi:superfamily I DNA/RNA helicase
VGDIAIQDLLAEPFTEVILPLLWLGARARDPSSWNEAQERLQTLADIGLDDELAQERMQCEIGEFSRQLRQTMNDQAPQKASADEIFARALAFIGVERLRRAYPEYQRDADFARVSNGLRSLLRECVSDAANWTEVLDRFEGKGQVPLMTIHKSKGLEFHTMIFFGLDDRSWWSLKPVNGEELNSFFVAFTRPMQRAFFSYCEQRGNSFLWLEELLVAAGVVRIDGVALVPDG